MDHLKLFKEEVSVKIENLDIEIEEQAKSHKPDMMYLKMNVKQPQARRDPNAVMLQHQGPAP